MSGEERERVRRNGKTKEQNSSRAFKNAGSMKILTTVAKYE